jgi:hypothetical protein
MQHKTNFCVYNPIEIDIYSDMLFSDRANDDALQCELERHLSQSLYEADVFLNEFCCDEAP